MKKFKAILVFMMITALLAGCGGKKNEEQKDNGSDTTQNDQSETGNGNTETGNENTGSEDNTQAFGENGGEIVITSLAVHYFEEMQNGNFANVVADFDSDMASACDEEQLRQIWDSYVSVLGAYQGILESSEEKTDMYTIVNVKSKFESMGLISTFVFDDESKIAGFNINYFALDENVADSGTEQDSLANNDMYYETKISIGDFALDGILTLPQNIDNPPVVILVQGSGQSDKDETIGSSSNKPFRDLAYGLAELGIASIRYDKRFYAHPEAASLESTIYNEVLDDASAAIAFAKSDGRVDGGRIFVAGHSLGGMLAPVIAYENTDVHGIISLAGSLRRLEDIIRDQNYAVIADAPGLTDEEKQELYNQVDELVASIKQIDANSDGDAIFNAGPKYWYSLNSINTVAITQGLTIPILILQGSADFQVYPEVDYLIWQTVLEGKDNASYKLYDGLNHLFMPTFGLKDVMEYDIANHVDTQVMADIAEWINNN